MATLSQLRSVDSLEKACATLEEEYAHCDLVKVEVGELRTASATLAQAAKDECLNFIGVVSVCNSETCQTMI